MIEHRIVPDSNIIEFVIDGTIEKEDLEKTLLACELFISEHDTIRILKHVKSIGSIDPSAAWDNLKWSWRNISHISHVALVADQKWMEIWSKLASPFVNAEVRSFGSDEIDQAREWLKSAD